LDQALSNQEEHVEDGLAALADGYQPDDEPVLRAALMGVRAEIVEIEDVGMDIDAIRRIATVGRHAVYDGRFMARERRTQALILTYRQKANGPGAVNTRSRKLRAVD